MRCTNCSRTVFPVVAIDIDGTLGGYHEHFTWFSELYLQKQLNYGTPYNGSMPFNEWLGMDKGLYRQVKLAYRQGGMKRSMPISKGAVEMMRCLQGRAEIWITTTRPYQRLDNIDPDTRFWLDYHGLKFDGILYDEDKYQKLADIVDKERVVGVLDDLAEQHDAASRVFGSHVPIQIRRPHNACTLRTPRAATLTTAANMLNLRIDRWNRRNNG